MKKTIVIFGNGYVSTFLSKALIKLDWVVYCTSRKIEPKKKAEHKNIKIIHFFDPNLPEIIKSANVILSTVPTDDQMIDPILERYLSIISQGKFD